MSTRLPDAVEFRAPVREVTASGDRRLTGWAAVFDTPAMIGDGFGRFIETIRPNAFRSSLNNRSDILAIVDHDPTKLIGRTRSGSLLLSEHPKGLAYTIDLPRTSLGDDVLALAKRGDLGGMSFGFTVPEGGEIRTGNMRELVTVDLIEISVVSAFPAYQGTTVNARMRCNADPARERERYLSSI